MIDEKYKWQHVMAVVNVSQKRFNILLQRKLFKSFDYS